MQALLNQKHQQNSVVPKEGWELTISPITHTAKPSQTFFIAGRTGICVSWSKLPGNSQDHLFGNFPFPWVSPHPAPKD